MWGELNTARVSQRHKSLAFAWIGVVAGTFGLFGLFASSVDGPDPDAQWAFGAMSALFYALGLAASLWSYRRRLELASLRFDAGGARRRIKGRLHALRWDSISAIRTDGPRVVLDGGARCVTFRPEMYRNAAALFGAVRLARPDLYALTSEDERRLTAGAGLVAPTPRPTSSVVTTPVAAGYRQSPPARHERLPSMLQGLRGIVRLRGFQRGVAVIALGTACAAAAVVVDPHPVVRGLGVLGLYLGGGAIALVAFVLSGTLMAARPFRRFLGPELVEAPDGIWTSLDGRRRFRATPADHRDPWAGAHLHLEELAADGVTIASHVVPDGRPAPGASWRPLEAEHARVAPRPGGVRCFRGAPWEDKAEPMPLPAHLLLSRVADGFVLTRFSEDLAYAGDTWHPSRDHAAEQVTRELAVSPAWRRLDEPPTGFGFLAEETEKGRDRSPRSDPAEHREANERHPPGTISPAASMS